METGFDEDHRGALPESWAVPFHKALSLRGRPASRLKWYFIWARRFAAYLSGGSLHLASREDAEGFLSTLSSSPGIGAWQVEQATDALTILLGSVFGQEWARTIRIPAPPPPPDVPVPVGGAPVEQLRYAIRCRGYSVRTERSYAFWVDRYLAFCRDGGLEQDADAVRAFLERLVIADQMSASTQGQALNALVFYFKHVVGTPFGDLGEFQRSKRPRKLPVVLGREEVRRLLAKMLPRLPLTRRQIREVFSLVCRYLEDRSVIVRVCALQATFELSRKDPSLRGPVRELAEASCRSGAPALRARGRKLLTLLKEETDGL